MNLYFKLFCDFKFLILDFFSCLISIFIFMKIYAQSAKTIYHKVIISSCHRQDSVVDWSGTQYRDLVGLVEEERHLVCDPGD